MSQSKNSFDSMVSTLRSALEQKDAKSICPRKRKFEEMLETCYETKVSSQYTSRVRLMVVDGRQ